MINSKKILRREKKKIEIKDQAVSRDGGRESLYIKFGFVLQTRIVLAAYR